MTEKKPAQNGANPGSPAKALFLGNILENVIFPFPKISAQESETLQMVLESIDKFMAPKASAFKVHDDKGEQPQDYLENLKELGLFGLIIPEEYGGIGLSNSGYSRVLQPKGKHSLR